MRETDLSGTWRIRPDPGDAGVEEEWWRRDPEGFGDPIDVPSAWQTTLGTDYHGVAWYLRTVTIPEAWRTSPAGRIRITFDAVATDAQVWVDDHPVGRHVGDWVPFAFDITEAAAGKDRLRVAVRVDEIFAPRRALDARYETGHITKGYHDVQSLQHGGIWQGVRLVRSGAITALPNGVAVLGDPAARDVEMAVELTEPAPSGGTIRVDLRGPEGEAVATETYPIDPGEQVWRGILRLDEVEPWSPASPALYTARISVADPDGLADDHEVRFGFRTVRPGGPDGTRILLNGEPICIRGVLDWGHEPDRIAPAPSPEEVRERFGRLQDLGINTVALCMVYPPPYLFDIADEMGMLIWQVHPVWKAPMEESRIEEYKRLYSTFFRRDRNHPSVAIVSGTCEHENFAEDLAVWWWEEARRQMPDRLLQAQTGFLSWVDTSLTDLHDEHIYDSSGRWTSYLRDLQDALAALPPKPFVMGETIVSTSWPDVGGLEEVRRESSPWWLPGGLESMRRAEEAIAKRHGAEAVDRFRRQAERFALIGRKFQVERLRSDGRHGGFVLNHLRDVARCQCGLIDDLGRWRARPEEWRGWLDDAPLILETPDHRSGFFGGHAIDCKLLVSNFGSHDFDGEVRVRPGDSEKALRIRCPRGEVAGVRWWMDLPAVGGPTRLPVVAEAEGLASNRWDLWLFPMPEVPEGAYRATGPAFDLDRQRPTFEEKCYSSGWGLPAARWRNTLPDVAALLPEAPSLGASDRPPKEARVVVTAMMTPGLLAWMAEGGRVVLLAGSKKRSPPAEFINLWAQVPYVSEEGLLQPGDSEWVIDLLGYDLGRRSLRAIPVERMGIAGSVDPIVRLHFTHDTVHRVRIYDHAFQARVGEGHLIVSALDHGGDAGRYLLGLFMTAEPAGTGRLDPESVHSWI